MPSHVVTAPAKLNLHLNVVGRRSDGYHLLDSLIAFCCLSDSLTIEEQPHLSLAADGPFADRLGDPDDNLVLKAARILAAASGGGQGARIRLDKRIPVAAGLGGGSADAAAVLLGLNEFWQLGWSRSQLSPIARSLGADVPMCLSRQPQRARGIGDDLSPVADLPACGVLLVNSGAEVPTVGVFQSFAAENTRLEDRWDRGWPGGITMEELIVELRARGNDLIPAAARFEPRLYEVLEEMAGLPGALYCSMSGSGGTCFALFADRPAAERAAMRLSQRQPGWWLHAGRLLVDADQRR